MGSYVGGTGLTYLWGKIKSYISSAISGKADKNEIIAFNAAENTSGTGAVTAESPYTAAIWRVDLSSEIAAPYTGLTIFYKIPVAGNGTYGTLLRIDGTSASGDSSSNLYPVCANVTTMVSTRYAVDCIIPLTFDADQVGQKLYYDSASAYTTAAGGTGWTKPGCWKIADYDANTNTIGYQLRTNNASLTVTDRARYYKIYFTSADGTQWVPSSSNWTNDATTARAVNQRKINPFGPIVYTSASTNYTAGSVLAAGSIWQQYIFSLGYAFNVSGGTLSLTVNAPVYVKCAPQSDGSAIIDATTPIVQALPSTEDGKIYIFLGIAYSETNIELRMEHPIYYYKDSAIRLWTNAASSSVTVGTLNTNNTSAQTASSSESFSGTINLHKVSKTGSYDDLLNKPTIPSVAALTNNEIDTIWTNAMT